MRVLFEVKNTTLNTKICLLALMLKSRRAAENLSKMANSSNLNMVLTSSLIL